MNIIQTSLLHKVLPPKSIGSSNHPALIMLHGRGADENDLLGLAQFLDERLFIISVRAPFPFEGGGGFAWYDALEIGRPEPKMFAESYRKLVQFLEDVIEGYPVDARQIYLLGFSMGTMMSYALFLTRPELIAGVIANSGYVPEETDLDFQWDKLAGKVVFIAHGTDDPVIPVHFGRRAKELFSTTQADVTYREYPMAHQISDESLTDMPRWLSDHLDGKD